MKIAIVLNGLCYPDIIGGMEIFAYRLATELGKKHYQVYLLGYSGKKLKGKVKFEHFEFWGSSFRDLKAQPFMLINLLKIKPDVCLAISFHSTFPIVLYSIFFPIHSLVRYSGTDAYRLGNRLRINNVQIRILYCILFWFVKKRFINISLSQDMYKVLLSKGIHKKLIIIPNPVDEVFFKSTPNYNSKIIGYVGRLEYIKGCDILIKAFSIVKKKSPDLKLILVGDGSRKRDLIHLAKKLGIQDSVQMMGFVTYERIPLLLSKFSLFVLPSRSEGMPNVLLQAMAMSLPVIASRVGGIPDLIDDKINGFLVKPEDPTELASTILFFLKNKIKAKEIARNACIKAEKYRMNKIVSIYESIFNLK